MNIPLAHDFANVEPTVYLVDEQANPSTDFFVLPALQVQGCRVIRCGFADLPAVADLTGTMLVFVRYIPPGWVKLVEAVRSQLMNLVFFMDDDVLDVKASVGMPWRYRFKLARLAAWRLKWLQQQQVQLWVSTPYLQHKYAAWRPKLVLPSPVANLEVRRVFYHGTASHGAEIRWLRPVLEAALSRDQSLVFEIAGGHDVQLLYRGLPRVSIVHSMKWTAYQAFLSLQGRHIGLNPLQATPFNQARSYTKFFDITRCGAVGIYAPDSACAEVVSHELDGLVVAQDQEAWVSAILKLAHDEPLRQTLLRNAKVKAIALGEQAQYSYSGLITPGKI